MSVLLITPHYIYPPDFGGAVRVYATIKVLEKHGIRPIVVQISEEKRERYYRKLIQIVYKRIKDPFRIIPIIFLLVKLIRKYKVKKVLIEYTTFRTAILVPFIRLLCPKTIIVVDAHNVEYIAKKGRWSILALIVTFLTELIAARTAHFLFTVSHFDKRIFQSIYGRKKRIYLAGNGINIDEFLNAQEDEEIKKYKPCAVFHGLYVYKPNNVAIKFIIEKIAPKLPELHFIIFGKGSEIIKKEYKNLPKNVIVLGTVSKDRIAKILKACDIAVVPIFWGSGTNLKMIEYLAAGLTIVATPMAARGLGLIPNKHFYLARNEEEFVNKIRFALENKLDEKELIKKATEFDWDKVLKKLVLVFHK